MASISSLMGGTSASSSIYGSRNANIISGLGSGLDTESMIEGLVQSYQQKITGLQQDRTKVQWKQEAYQSVSDKMVEFYRTYMSFAYNSPTNLFSASFFNSAVKTSAAGDFANLVSAVGKSNSEIVLKSVAQLAKAARYTTSGTADLISNSGIKVEGGKITATGEAMVPETHMSNLEGSLSVKYSNQTVSIDLGALDLMGEGSDGTGKLDPKKLEEAINKQLKEQTIKGSGTNGTSGTADEYIKVEVSADGKISFSDKKNSGNTVSVTSASGKLSDALTAKPDGNSGTIQIKQDVVDKTTTSKSTAEALTGKTVTVTLDGKTKTFTLGKDLKDGKTFSSLQEVADDLTKQVNDAFGAGVKVGFQGNKLSFEVAEGSSLSVTSEASEALGLGKSGLTSYVNAGKTLGELLGDNMGGLTGQDKTTEKITEEKQSDGTITYKDANGHKVDKDGYFLNDKGERTQRYDLTINGKTVGSFTKDDSLDRVMNTINNSDAGVKVQFSKTTGQFVFTAKDTGEAGRIEIKDNTLGAKLFGAVDPNAADKANYTKGQDAIFQVEVNGKTMNLARSTNAVEIDGMTLNFKGTFNVAENVGGDDGVISNEELNDAINSSKLDSIFAKDGKDVTFTSETDADTIVDAVKKMVADYNKILDSVKDLYGTRPLTQGNGKGYEPLTAKDAEDMTETEIKNYEEKAKTGLLYMDSDLSSLYNSLRGVLTKNSGLLKSVGLSTEYSNGKTSLKLDETALRQALAENPESVKDAFVSSTENGGATDGLMAQMKQVVDRYAGTSGATKGILIEKAGSKYSPTAALNNTMLDKMNDIDKSIQKWQDKLSDRVDYYTNKFTQMEVLLQQMNSQSSALAGLMGG